MSNFEYFRVTFQEIDENKLKFLNLNRIASNCIFTILKGSQNQASIVLSSQGSKVNYGKMDLHQILLRIWVFLPECRKMSLRGYDSFRRLNISFLQDNEVTLKKLYPRGHFISYQKWSKMSIYCKQISLQRNKNNLVEVRSTCVNEKIVNFWHSKYELLKYFLDMCLSAVKLDYFLISGRKIHFKVAQM